MVDRPVLLRARRIAALAGADAARREPEPPT
jgi:hypothetical protein